MNLFTLLLAGSKTLSFAGLLLPLIKQAVETEQPAIEQYVHDKLAEVIPSVKANGTPEHLGAIVEAGAAFIRAVKAYVYSPATPTI